MPRSRLFGAGPREPKIDASREIALHATGIPRKRAIVSRHIACRRHEVDRIVPGG
jgi:hypothetical protein